MLGKRNINCLSCGKGGDPSQNVKGRDGKLYRGELTNLQLAQDDLSLYEHISPNVPRTYLHTSMGLNMDMG